MNFLFFILFINIVIIFFKKNINKFINIKDVPDNKKKFHKLPVTPSGGLIFLVNLIIIFLYFHFFFNNYLVNEVFFQSNKSLLSFLFGSFTLFLLGLLDDKYKLAPSIRLFFTFFFSICRFYQRSLLFQGCLCFSKCCFLLLKLT